MGLQKIWGGLTRLAYQAIFFSFLHNIFFAEKRSVNLECGGEVPSADLIQNPWVATISFTLL